MNQNASIRLKKTKPVEKAILINKAIDIDPMSGGERFKALCTLFVPKANVREKMPKLAFKMQVADDFVRPVTNSAEDMRDFLLELAAFVDENKENINSALEKEQEAWLDMQNAYIEARRASKDKKIINIKSA